MFTFNRKKFFDAYRLNFGALTQGLVDALEFLLAQFEQDNRFGTTDVDRRQLAYVLATFKHETAHTMMPIDEFGSDARFNSLYGPGTARGIRLGNTEPGDGARFHGRGYVQLTGRSNYANAAVLTGNPLTTSPELVKDPLIAYEIAINGMIRGTFTGRRLNQFINTSKTDFINARRIINGTDQAEPIANIARKFSEILFAAI
jgi:putative chitinase